MNDSILKGKWQQVRGEIKHTWGDLTNDDIERAEGSATKLAGVLRERYGWKQEEATRKVADFLESIEDKITSSPAAAS